MRCPDYSRARSGAQAIQCSGCCDSRWSSVSRRAASSAARRSRAWALRLVFTSGRAWYALTSATWRLLTSGLIRSRRRFLRCRRFTSGRWLYSRARSRLHVLHRRDGWRLREAQNWPAACHAPHPPHCNMPGLAAPALAHGFGAATAQGAPVMAKFATLLLVQRAAAFVGTNSGNSVLDARKWRQNRRSCPFIQSCPYGWALARRYARPAAPGCASLRPGDAQFSARFGWRSEFQTSPGVLPLLPDLPSQ